MQDFKNKLTLEICVDSVQSAIAAETGGANRIELCQSLSEGGITPSAGLIAIVRETVSIDIHVLIRPRRGDFLFSDLEFEVMKKDIAMAKQLGANGVVLGILKQDGTIDMERMEALIAYAHPLDITFHRAFDLTPDPIKALDDLLHLKVNRLLTSGQNRTALLGVELIRKLIIKAGEAMAIMPGGGINENNIADIIRKTGAVELHSSASKKVVSDMLYRRDEVTMTSNNPIKEYEQKHSDAALVKAILTEAEKVGNGKENQKF